MMANMKVEKIQPRGILTPSSVSSTGVQRKTKMYMADSAQVWMMPSLNTVLLLMMMLRVSSSDPDTESPVSP